MDRDFGIVVQVSAKIASDLAVATYNKTQVEPITDLFRVMFETVTPLLLEATGVENVQRAFPGAQVVSDEEKKQQLYNKIGELPSYPTGQYKPEPTQAPPSHVSPGPQNIPGVEDGDPQVAALWTEYFDYPDRFWDNRSNKRNPKGPDFSHKDKLQPGTSFKQGLWISDKKNPSWVRVKLQQAA